MSARDANDILRNGGADRLRDAFDHAERGGGVRRLVPVPWHRLHMLPKRESLIADLLDSTAMSVLYGGSNSGKTFLALDLAAHVALGQAWRGRRVRQGAVLYVAAEGGLGIEERLTAWRLHHNLDVSDVPFYVIPESIDLCRSDADANLLIQRIAELPPEPKLELVAIDTLSRAMAGGNENSPDDMGRFVAHCDKIRLATRAHVLVIHHSGKDDSRGARGHSLLKAAADTEIEVVSNETTGLRTATVAKQRDHKTGDVFGFRLEQVELGQDDYGKTVTSCVVEPTDAPIARVASKTAPPSKAARTALRALADAITEKGEPAPPSTHIPASAKVVSVETWRQQAYRMGISADDTTDRARQAAFKRALDSLIGDSKVGCWDGLVWLTS